jgi:hypothetical protein
VELKRLYRTEEQMKIERQIPARILEVLKEEGWNVFGIYETVKEVLQQTRPQAFPQPRKLRPVQ